MNTTLATAAEMMHGVLHGADREFCGVSTDSRSIADGELFVALSGPNFDGRDFVGGAVERGAAAAVVASLVDEDIAQIEVDDTLAALGRLGSAWRDTRSVTVVAVLLHAALLERAAQGRGVRWPGPTAIFFAAGLGWIDEGIQAVLPGRVYDLRDVVFNALAAAMAVTATVVLRWTGRQVRKDPRDAPTVE